MNAPCYQHPVQPATAACAECERPICVQCMQMVANRPVCTHCVEGIRARVGSDLNAQSASARPLYAGAAPPIAGTPPIGQASPALAARPLHAGSDPGGAVQPLYGAPIAASTARPSYPQPGIPASPMPSRAANGPNITLGIVVGLLLVVGVGAGFGFASIWIGFRVPFQTIAIGYIVGYAIRGVCGGPGPAQAMIAGVCSLAAAAASLGIMYLGGAVFSPIAVFLLVIAVQQGYRIAAR